MALRDTWHKALVYFGLAEDDYGPEYEEDFDPETGTEEAFESSSRRDRDRGDSASVRRLPTSRRARRDEIDDIFGDDEPIAPSRTRALRPVDNGAAATSRSTSSSHATSTTPSRSPTSSNARCR